MHVCMCVFMYGSIHSGSEIFENAAVSTVRPNVHTDPSRKRSFAKTLYQKHAHMTCGTEFSPSTNPKLLPTSFPGSSLYLEKERTLGTRSDCCVFKFLRRTYSVNGKHLIRFQSENAVFKILPASCGRGDSNLEFFTSKGKFCRKKWVKEANLVSSLSPIYRKLQCYGDCQ